MSQLPRFPGFSPTVLSGTKIARAGMPKAWEDSMRRLASYLLVGIWLGVGACADAHPTDTPDADAVILPASDATLPTSDAMPASDATLPAVDATLPVDATFTMPHDAAGPGVVARQDASSTPLRDAGPPWLDPDAARDPCCGPHCAREVTEPGPCGCSVRSGGAWDVVQQPLECGCSAGTCPDSYQAHLKANCSNGAAWTGVKGCGKVVVSPARIFNAAADYIFDVDSGTLVGRFVAGDTNFGPCCSGLYLYGAGAFAPHALHPDSHECPELTPCAVCGVDAGALPACFSAASRRP